MIQLDNNFNAVKAEEAGSFQRPPAGGYVFQVKAVEEKTSSNGNPMVVLSMDIAEGEYTGYFEKFPIKYYQLVTGEQTKYFKGMLYSFANSNSPMPKLILNNQFSPEPLVGLKVGGSLYEEEYRNQSGEIKTCMKIDYLRSADKISEIVPRGIKKLVGDNTTPISQTGQMPPAPTDDLPF